MKKSAVLIGIIAVTFLGVILSSSESVDDQAVKIGFVAPLSGDGASWGEIHRNAVEIAVVEINTNGGVRGRNIEVFYEDGKCEGAEAVSAAQKLIQVNEVKYLLVSCSQEILPIAPIAEEHHIPTIGMYSMSSAVSEAGDYIFRTVYSNTDVARGVSEVMLKDFSKVASINEISAFSSDLRDRFKDEIQNGGGVVVAEENYLQGARDMRSQISKVLDKNPETIFVNPVSPTTGIALLKQIRELGYAGQLYGNFFGGSLEVQSLPEAEGLIFFADPGPQDNLTSKTLFDGYKEKYKNEPELAYAAATAYDALYVLKEAIESANDNPSQVKDYLLTATFTGALGTFSFDQNGDPTGLRPATSVIKNGKVVELE